MKSQGIVGKKVFVGMSGGVDSSVAAALLKAATPNNFEKLFGRPTPEGFRGYDVTGVFMQVWQPDFLECTRTDDRREAMRAAAHLGIPFLTFDFQKEYKEKVVDYMIAEYQAGRTPNPDIMCNKYIKFDLFLRKAREMGADYIATGHYTRLEREFSIINDQFSKKQIRDENSNIENSLKIKNCKLKIAKDTNKDQSYFLWTLAQDQLKYCLFPIGDYTKPEVRVMARKFGLPNAERRDSQGVCFIGQFPMKEFLKKYIASEKGDVLDSEGNVIGTHDDARLYTLGERHGFLVTKKTPNDPPLYVVAKDIEKNTITVAPETAREAIKEATLAQVNFISGQAPEEGELYDVRFRYRQALCPAKLEIENCLPAEASAQAGKLKIHFANAQNAVTPGQSLVIYKGDECIGGGVIAS